MAKLLDKKSYIRLGVFQCVFYTKDSFENKGQSSQLVIFESMKTHLSLMLIVELLTVTNNLITY